MRPREGQSGALASKQGMRASFQYVSELIGKIVIQLAVSAAAKLWLSAKNLAEALFF